MRSADGYDELELLVAERGRALLASATLLAGGRPAGEDLLQAALERVMRRWPSVTEEPETYLRRTMYHLAVDQWRARRRRPEVFAVPNFDVEGSDATAAVDLRHALLQALSQLPPRQRAVLVLRYWEQRTEAETAELLGCSLGTVKSSASRGLARLRETWADDQLSSSKGALS